MNDLTFCGHKVYQERGIWRLNDGVTTFTDAEAVATWIYQHQDSQLYTLKGMTSPKHPLAEAYRLVIGKASHTLLHWDLNWFFSWWIRSGYTLGIAGTTLRLETHPATFLQDEPVFLLERPCEFTVYIQGNNFGGGRLRNLAWREDTPRLQVRECLGSVGIGKDLSMIIEEYLMSYVLMFEEFEEHRRRAFRAFNEARPLSNDFRINPLMFPWRMHLTTWMGRDGILRLEFAH